MKLSRIILAAAILALVLSSSNVLAKDCLSVPYKDGNPHSFLPNNDTNHATGPSYKDADAEFGAGALDNTECVGKAGKLVLQVDNDGGALSSAPWLSTYGFFLRNYEIQGLQAGSDVKIAVVLSSRGAILGTQGRAIGGNDAPNDAANVAKVQDALNRGFEIFVCQTAARGLGINQSDLIPGVKFTPGGHLMVADKQMDGYAHLIYK